MQDLGVVDRPREDVGIVGREDVERAAGLLGVVPDGAGSQILLPIMASRPREIMESIVSGVRIVSQVLQKGLAEEIARSTGPDL